MYLITPPVLELDSFVSTLETALAAGDVAALQLRLKDVDDAAMTVAVQRLQPICAQHEVALILNDRPDLAAALDCDGVHIGQDDMPYAQARQVMGANRMIGVTAHDSRHLAMEAADAGADYVAFGAFFPSTTKEAKSQAEFELVAWWSELMTVPCVAIGGITVENCHPLVEAGADFLAVSAGVWNHKDGPITAIRAFNAIFAG